MTGYAISLVLLVISLIIFTYFRQLRCSRVILHQHLFVSFILTGIMWVVSYLTVMAVPGISMSRTVSRFHSQALSSACQSDVDKANEFSGLFAQLGNHA
ncbi:calcitonin receptor [Plakobranchus ocellatus]|uniref:Calcitonin receptor n=1 Tax=Plakobranchus ocellatus TaxID=259542 RepID=A0AAV4CV25_9GAST|nr:calcitonin receptor [Plakobranchus ocellatus]